MRRAALLLLATGLTLAGCAGDAPSPAKPAAAPTTPTPVPLKTSQPPAPPIAAPPPASRPANDTCGLAALGDLVGKPRMEIPVPVDVSRRRVVCEGCPVTQDFRPDRQTVWYDQTTGRVTRLQCG